MYIYTHTNLQAEKTQLLIFAKLINKKIFSPHPHLKYPYTQIYSKGR